MNWHGGKGSKRRNSDDKLYSDNQEKVFGKPKPKVSVRTEKPNHGLTHGNKDKTKLSPRKEKYKTS